MSQVSHPIEPRSTANIPYHFNHLLGKHTNPCLCFISIYNNFSLYTYKSLTISPTNVCETNYSIPYIVIMTDFHIRKKNVVAFFLFHNNLSITASCDTIMAWVSIFTLSLWILVLNIYLVIPADVPHLVQVYSCVIQYLSGASIEFHCEGNCYQQMWELCNLTEVWMKERRSGELCKQCGDGLCIEGWDERELGEAEVNERGWKKEKGQTEWGWEGRGRCMKKI